MIVDIVFRCAVMFLLVKCREWLPCCGNYQSSCLQWFHLRSLHTTGQNNDLLLFVSSFQLSLFPSVLVFLS